MMRDLRATRVPKITDPRAFEVLCRDICVNDGRYEHVQLHGRPGQSQYGVDVFGFIAGNRGLFGVQCRVRERTSGLTEEGLREEIRKALQFRPSLTEYWIYTTLDRDARLQETVRGLADELRNSGQMAFGIRFWDDIEEALKQEPNLSVYHRYYRAYFADNTTLGHAIGKLVNLELGVGTRLDTHYELMIGKIPEHESSGKGSVDYYRSTYFVVNFHERKMETFTLPCFPTDLEQAFGSWFDRFRIAKWINSMPDLDGFIYRSTDEPLIFQLSPEERRQWLEGLRDGDD